MDERKESLERFIRMIPEAIDRIDIMLDDVRISPMLKAQLIEMILDRGLGKPEETITMITDEAGTAESYRRIREMIEKMQEEDFTLKKPYTQKAEETGGILRDAQDDTGE